MYLILDQLNFVLDLLKLLEKWYFHIHNTETQNYQHQNKRKGSAYTRYGLLEDHLTEEFNHVIIHQNKFYITDGHHFLHGFDLQ